MNVFNFRSDASACPFQLIPPCGQASTGSSSILKRIGITLIALASLADAKVVNVSFAFWGDHYKLSKDSTGMGGFGGLKTLFDREEHSTIRICTGDLLFPNLLSMRDKGRHRIDILNDFNLTAMILGNHDLDGGTVDAQERILESNFPWLAANILDKKGDYFTGERQKLLLDIEGIRVGIFGLITETVAQLGFFKNNITVTPVISTAKKIVKELKSLGAQLIIAGTHMDPDEDERLALEVPEINGIFGGHDHSKIAKIIGQTVVMKPGQDAQYLATVRFQITSLENSTDLTITPFCKLTTNQNIEENIEIVKKIHRYQQGMDSVLKELYALPLGQSDQSYDSLSDNVRSKASPLGTLIASSLQDYHKVDLGFLVGGNIRGDKILNPGDIISYGDAMEILPFGNTLVLLEVSGAKLLEALENGVSKSGNNPLELSASSEKKPGRFPQLSGMTYTFDPTQLPGQRIVRDSVLIQGAPLDPVRNYRVATCNFLAEGGEEYTVFKEAKVLTPYSDEVLIVDIFANYVKSKPSMRLPAVKSVFNRTANIGR